MIRFQNQVEGTLSVLGQTQQFLFFLQDLQQQKQALKIYSKSSIIICWLKSLERKQNPMKLTEQKIKSSMNFIIINKMIGSLKFSNREGKNSKRFLQPPALHTFDLFSSQDKEERYEQEIQQLSNVEEKSYFQSEPEVPDHLDIQDFLGKMKQIGEKQLTPQKSRARSQRLEDQEIIVVEEENEVGSNLGGNESVILEHIEFHNESHPENTPEWENEEDGLKNKGQEIRYVINYVSESSPPWITKDNDNISSSTPYDIENSEFKLSHNRHSKNTCIDRIERIQIERIQTEKNLVNKSCIEKPISFDEDSKRQLGLKFPNSSIQQKNKNKNIQDILSKWNDEIYPRLENQYRENELNLVRRASADFKMERDAKFCRSKFEEESQNMSKMEEAESVHQKKSKASTIKKQSTDVQTDISGEELLHNQKYLNEEMAQLKSKNQRLQEDFSRLKQRAALDQSELIKIKDSLKNKEFQMDNLKSSYRQTQEQSELQKKWGEESRRLSIKNKELEKLISIQNEAIKQFEEKNEALSKKLHKTVSYNTFSSPEERSPTFFGGSEYQSVKFSKLSKLHTFGLQQQQNIHQKCKKDNEELQEYIFDLEQRFAGIDIEVERRVRLITETIQSETIAKLSQQNKAATNGIKEELNRYKEAYKILQYKHRENEEKREQKEQELQERQKEVNRMYDELVKEWKQIETRCEQEKKYTSKNEPKLNKYYSPKTSSKSYFEYQKLTSSKPIFDNQLTPQGVEANQYCYSSNKELKNPNFARERINFSKKNVENNNSVSYIPPEDVSFRKNANRLNETEKFDSSFTKVFDQNRWDRRVLSKPEYRQNNQLTAINNKIQRLRKEINKQLCSIH